MAKSLPVAALPSEACAGPSTYTAAAPSAVGVPASFQPALLLRGEVAGSAGVLDPSGKYKLRHGDTDYPTVEVLLAPGDGVFANRGTMLSMHGGVDMRIVAPGGLGVSIVRSMATGTSPVFLHFQAGPSVPLGSAVDLLLAPQSPGSIALLPLYGPNRWTVEAGAYFCSDPTVGLAFAFQGFARGLLTGEGFFTLEAGGVGRLLIAVYGSLVRYDLSPGQSRCFDHGVCAAWTTGMRYGPALVGSSWWKSWASGQGVVVEFWGPGTVYVATRKLKRLAQALGIKKDKGGDDGKGGDGGGGGGD